MTHNCDVYSTVLDTVDTFITYIRFSYVALLLFRHFFCLLTLVPFPAQLLVMCYFGRFGRVNPQGTQPPLAERAALRIPVSSCLPANKKANIAPGWRLQGYFGVHSSHTLGTCNRRSVRAAMP